MTDNNITVEIHVNENFSFHDPHSANLSMSLVANSVTRFLCARLIFELPPSEHEMLSAQLVCILRSYRASHASVT